MIKALLDMVSVRGQIVTIDAIGTQKEIAEKIGKGKGDYVLAVKENQKTLHEDPYAEQNSGRKHEHHTEMGVGTA
ncbi:hypothetical protein AGMMS49546_20110 [Spirochaetia bacterium]|nr:hypothetical protein AGMMS49546_20110 [Spirochaetia bacterium]